MLRISTTTCHILYIQSIIHSIYITDIYFFVTDVYCFIENFFRESFIHCHIHDYKKKFLKRTISFWKIQGPNRIGLSTLHLTWYFISTVCNNIHFSRVLWKVLQYLLRSSKFLGQYKQYMCSYQQSSIIYYLSQEQNYMKYMYLELSLQKITIRL